MLINNLQIIGCRFKMSHTLLLRLLKMPRACKNTWGHDWYGLVPSTNITAVPDAVPAKNLL
jgi:hypothetical protein